MGCYRPIPAHQGGPGGKVTLWPPLGTETLQLPCGRCLGCRTDRATEWSTRSQHEASQHQHNIFITLTYDDHHEPRGGHLNAQHLTNFLKRLRQAQRRNPAHFRTAGSQIRYLACGEYGDKHGRPHYHAILYNCGFTDEKIGRTTRHGPQYTSETLARLWPHGLTEYGIPTGGAAGYIAAYSLKKSRKHWSQKDGYADEDGVWHEKPEPFLRMSLKPAIGAAWFDRYSEDTRQGFIIQPTGRPTRVPRHYVKRAERLGNGLDDEIKFNAWRAAITKRANTTEERLKAQEIIHQRRKQLTEQRKL